MAGAQPETAENAETMRMKNFFWSFLFCLLLAAPAIYSAEHAVKRGLFVSVIQEPSTLSSREEILKLIEFSKKARVDTLFVQIYRANKAWFPSKVGDSGPYKAGLKSVGEDPFQLLIREARAAGIQVHAWLNLLSLSANTDAPLLKKYGTVILTRKPGGEKKTLEDYKIDNQYFLEPGDSRVRMELSTLVEEILLRYPALDGLQLDYIRYPDSHPFYGYTGMNIVRFRHDKGSRQSLSENNPAWKDWRRGQVTEMVELLAGTARAIRPAIQVSTTGCAPYSRAYHEAFQDWGSWLDRGLVDFVTMMDYPTDVPEFENTIAGARKKTRDFGKVNIGIGAYKLTQAPGVFTGQLESCEKAGGRGCVVFHYGSLLENPALKDPLLTQK